ncbi:hypothetical protein FN846DRAFT_962460 [Sphaerosporella brunnea]|uniref:SET domain-containing protein n=1 Tax=Sphaerosporella brunnea TaxID=1250544 RepID=A0A5J5EPD9_9PEZI|nr:hypothetical protein FN846DRAFT_962460 [Sphaerosporella brunnea]
MPPKQHKPKAATKPAAPSKRNRSSGTALPPNWPPHLPYLTAPRLSSVLAAPIPSTAAAPALSALNLHAPTPPSTPSPLVRIRRIDDPSHPAHGQHGLFAARNLPARSWILDYLGRYHAAEESDPASDYDISLDRESGVAVDAQSMGNEGRFVNDYRGVPGKERPNVEFETRRVGGKAGADGQLRMGIWVLSKDIKKGQELLVSYGKGFWDGRKAE